MNGWVAVALDQHGSLMRANEKVGKIGTTWMISMDEGSCILSFKSTFLTMRHSQRQL